jgi:hypothetical protein
MPQMRRLYETSGRHGRISCRLVVCLALLGIAASVNAQKGPVINDRFPIRNGNELSPPIVSPIGDCAKAVHVSGYIPHALIRVYANTTEQIGVANPYFADADVPLTREVHTTDLITATQTVLGFTSAQSPDPVRPGPYPGTLNKPVVGPDLYACGQVVPVNNLNPGTHVTVFQPHPTAVGQADATGAWQPVVTSSLNDTQPVTAVQVSCPNDTGKTKTSSLSDPVNVHPDPTPIPTPSVESYPVGADAVVLDNLLVGSAVQITDNGAPSGGGLSTASRNRAPLTPPATASSHVSASQKLCTSSSPSPPQPPTTTLPVPVIVTPVCEGSHSITVLNTYVNSIVVLFRNGVIAGMAGGELGPIVMNLGDSLTFNFGDEIQVVQYTGSVISARSDLVYVGCGNVITQHNDNARTGGYTVETKLTPANIQAGSFGLLYSRPVTGDILAQPLYVRGVMLPPGGKLNLFYVATSTNDVYAFDADNTAASAAPVWHRNLCGSVHSGVCGETYSGFVGVTSTPVIDPVSKTLYVVARCSDGTGGPRDGQVNLYALDIATGADKIAPRTISAVYQNVPFDPHCQRNRPGLLLQGGIIYVGFATFSCDAGCAAAPYHGWVIGYHASDLSPASVFCTSPSNASGRGGAGIWQTGKGLVGSPDGSIYFATGNAVSSSEPLNNSFVKIPMAAGTLTALGHFTPNNATTALHPGTRSLNDGDTDLGSGGPLLLPGGHLIGGGKQGRYYVLDTATMHLSQDTTPDTLGYDGFQAFTNTYHADSTHTACPAAGGAAGCDPTGGHHDNRCFIAPVHYGDGELCGPNIHSGPVYFQADPTFGLVYQMPEKDFLKAFKYDLTTGHVSETPFLTANGPLDKPPMDGMPGGYSSVSSNGSTNGIVWTSMPNGDAQWVQTPGRMAAFNATTLKQIWSDDSDALFAKSVPPTIADGKVIRALGGFPGSVNVYGLTGHGAAPHPTPDPAPQAAARQALATPSPIQQKYNMYTSVSIVGKPISDERPVGDSVGGRYQDFKGSVFGMAMTVTSIKDNPGDPLPTCSVPVGTTKVVLSSIYWSPKTGAHLVLGDIRDLWLKLGGPKSKLGYPISDETNTSDHYGRMSTFQNGQIWWYPDKGAYVSGTPNTNLK